MCADPEGHPPSDPQLMLASPQWALPASSPLFLPSFPKGSWAEGQMEGKPLREVNLRAPREAGLDHLSSDPWWRPKGL